jgi:hypothetical protein
MIEIIFFITLPIALGTVLGSLIYLFLEEQEEIRKNRPPEPSLRDMLKEMDKSLEMDVSDEMAELRKRLSGK